jgi:hypothetical protein
MTFSPFDKKLLEEGLAYFARPRLAILLEMLGSDERERLDVLITMLRNAPPDEYEEAVELFERATAKAERRRTWDEHHERDEEPRRRRYSASAERREQRRQSG